MALPREGAALHHFFRSGYHLEAMLDLEDKTRPFLSPLEEANKKLKDLEREEEDLERSQIRAYARVLWCDRKIEDAIRDASAELKKGERDQPGERFHDAIFPEGGYTNLIQPSGRMLSKQIDDILGRLPLFDAVSQKLPSFASYKTSLENLCNQAKVALQTLAEIDRKLTLKDAEIEAALRNWREITYTIEADLSKLFPGKKDLVRDFFAATPTRRSKKTEA